MCRVEMYCPVRAAGWDPVWDPSALKGPGLWDGHLDNCMNLVPDGSLRPDAVFCLDGVSTAYLSGALPSLHPAPAPAPGNTAPAFSPGGGASEPAEGRENAPSFIHFAPSLPGSSASLSVCLPLSLCLCDYF